MAAIIALAAGVAGQAISGDPSLRAGLGHARGQDRQPYLTLTNRGPSPDRLFRIATEAAQIAACA